MRKPLHPISSLIIKHLEGTTSMQEAAVLEDWINESAENQALFEELCDEYRLNQDLTAYSEDKKATWEKIIALAPELGGAPVRRMRWWRYAGIAGAALLVGLGTWWYFNKGAQPVKEMANTSNERFKNDVAAPSGNNAILQLADGRTINLDSVTDGQLASQGMMQVVKENGATIEYRESSTVDRELPVVYNTINTRKGGRYKVVLADNSVVWLNAVSSLRFPTAFLGEERVVELTGEAYFEVAQSYVSKDSKERKPFIVKVNGMQVDVLGTHFNVMSYDDENSIKTTLLEGSVRVTPVPVSGGGPVARRSQLLSPGQQASFEAQQQQIKVAEADTEEAIAWTNEEFIFNNASIENIMREVARNYDVEIVYEGARTTEKFNVMGVSRKVPVSRLLKVLELTEKVKFEIEGQKITVKRA